MLWSTIFSVDRKVQLLSVFDDVLVLAHTSYLHKHSTYTHTSTCTHTSNCTHTHQKSLYCIIRKVDYIHDNWIPKKQIRKLISWINITRRLFSDIFLYHNYLYIFVIKGCYHTSILVWTLWEFFESLDVSPLY